MKYLVLFLISCFYWQSGAGALMPSGPETKYIWSKIPFFEAGDFIAFKEAYSKSRRDLRRDYIKDAEDLIYAGAFGLEALEMVLAFDEQVTWLRRYSRVGINHTLTSHFRGEFDKLLEINKPFLHKVRFRQAEDAVELIQSVNSSLQPGFLTPSRAQLVNYVSYGTYTTTSKGLKLSLHIIDVQSGTEINFSVEEKMGLAVKKLAKEVFDYYYVTRFPSTLTLANGGTLDILWRDYIYTASAAPFSRTWDEANEHCRDLGGRLPSLAELRSIDRAGDYRGGASINTNEKKDYYWALSYLNVYSAHTRTVNRVQFLNGAQYLNYLCVLDSND